MTLMRSRFFGELIKKLLVRLLITGKRTLSARNRRTIHLGMDLKITDALEGRTRGLTVVEVTAPFSAIHMASQGYWQVQDDRE